MKNNIDFANNISTEGSNEEINMIYRKLKFDNNDWKLYFRLAECKKMTGNYEQALFSYRNALQYAKGDEKSILLKKYNEFLKESFSENKAVSASIILVTYNQLEYTKRCIQSIRNMNYQDAYEIIVVDNLSKDGTREWLAQQNDIKVIYNDKNVGFPKACNQGGAIATENNDIFLLNNDTILMRNSLFNLHMALYESEKIGGVGACSNSVGGKQKVGEEFESIEDWEKYSNDNNYYHPEAHKKAIRLIGFALLIRRDVWENLNGFDEKYGIGNFEDDDFCMKILTNGFSLKICEDSFIFHFGGTSFQSLDTEKEKGYRELISRNKGLFEEKWKIDWKSFSSAQDLIFFVDDNRKKSLDILDIGCSAGATLIELENRYPNASLYGIERDDILAQIARNYFCVKKEDVAVCSNPYDTLYDYIILGNVLEYLEEPEIILNKIKSWLKPDGYLLISVYNIMHISSLLSLLHGEFFYEGEDRHFINHRGFTGRDIFMLMKKCGLHVENLEGTTIELSKYERIYIEKLVEMDSEVYRDELEIYLYLLKVAMLQK